MPTRHASSVHIPSSNFLFRSDQRFIDGEFVISFAAFAAKRNDVFEVPVHVLHMGSDLGVSFAVVGASSGLVSGLLFPEIQPV